jgi:hypothetical protein
MAVARELETDEASSKTGSITNNRKCERASRGKPARKDGVERLRREADKLVWRDSKELAGLLSAKALKGDLPSTKTLVGLAEGKKPRPEPVKKRRGLSQAEQLMAEPQWQGPPLWEEKPRPRPLETVA